MQSESHSLLNSSKKSASAFSTQSLYRSLQTVVALLRRCVRYDEQRDGGDCRAPAGHHRLIGSPLAETILRMVTCDSFTPRDARSSAILYGDKPSAASFLIRRSSRCCSATGTSLRSASYVKPNGALPPRYSPRAFCARLVARMRSPIRSRSNSAKALTMVRNSRAMPLLGPAGRARRRAP